MRGFLVAVLLACCCQVFAKAESTFPCYEASVRTIRALEVSSDSGKPIKEATATDENRNWEHFDCCLRSDVDQLKLWFRVPLDSILLCTRQRVITVRANGEVTFFRQGEAVSMGGMNHLHERALDRSSIVIDSTFAVAGYVYFHASLYRPYSFGSATLPTRGLALLSTPVSAYRRDDVYRYSTTFSWRDFHRISLLTAGGSFSLMLYFFIIGVKGRSKWVYFTYALFLLCTGVYWIERSVFIEVFLLSGREMFALNVLPQLAIHLFYIAFVYQVTDARQTIPKLASIWRIAALGLAAYGVWVTIAVLGLGEYLVVRDSFVVERVMVLALSMITVVVLLANNKNIYHRLVAIGTLVYCVFGLVAMFGNAVWFALGTAVQLAVFAYAAGLRIEEDRRLKLVSEQRAFELEREVGRTRDAALRAQMKPHFVSNVINALRSLVLDGENDKAYQYLSKFAHLVRSMLGNAETTTIPLSEELNLLRNYIELEGLRFDREIEFQVTGLNDFDSSSVQVPPLLLQPLVENCIHHGFAGLTDRSPSITLNFTKDGEHSIQVVVRDNGIGRIAAGKRTRLRTRPSMATSIVKQRLEMMQESIDMVTLSTPNEKRLHFTDLVDEHGNSAGTAVELTIPLTTSVVSVGWNHGERP